MVITHIKCFQDSTDKNQTVWYPIQCSLLVHIWNTSILCPRTIQPHICASMYQNTNASPFILGLTMDFQGAKSGWVTNLRCLTLEMPRKTTDPQEAMSRSLILYVLKRWQNERFTAFNLLNVRKISLLVNILVALLTSWTARTAHWVYFHW